MDRRHFLKIAVASAGAVALPSWRDHRAIAEPGPAPFRHGVASGDPLPDGVIIWTRLTPDGEPLELQGTGAYGTSEEIEWEVATDAAFAHVVAASSVITGPERDFTVKVDVRGLDPATRYWYRFHHDGRSSEVGETLTAPGLAAAVPSLRFGFVSCSNYEGGYFTPYRFLADRDDLDFVLHLGDYYYEYASGGYGPGPAIGRVHRPAHEILTLADYRQRHASYREDADLRELHRRQPFVLTWDDHEVANNSWADGAENHQAGEGSYLSRKAAAYQAYFEWLPVREAPATAPGELRRLYRRLQFGTLADLSMLDLRQYRSEQIESFYGDAVSVDPAASDPARTITGREQMDWLKAGLASSTTQWHLVGNSVMITPIHFPPLPRELGTAVGELFGVGPHEGIAGNIDQWDGYAADRAELLGHIASEGIDDVVFLVGDVHSSFACDLPLDAALYPDLSPSVATELVSTSVTSDNFNEITRTPPRTTTVLLEEYFKANNRHIKLYEFDSHGASVVDVTSERLQIDWHYVDDRTAPNSPMRFAQSFVVGAGSNRVEPGTGSLPPR